ncbi:hypothetical protein ACQJBY_000970 [Aegilops geniculata]
MGNSCVTGACSQGSNGSGTTIKWRIDGFSSLVDKDEGRTNSSVFVIKGLNWYLMLNPRDRKSGDQNEYVTLKLVLTKVSERSHMVAETTFKFLIYDQLYGKHHEEHQVSHDFQATSRFSGTSCMIPLATLKEQSSGFLVNDSCVFGVQFIKVVAVKEPEHLSRVSALWTQMVHHYLSIWIRFEWELHLPVSEHEGHTP